MMMLKEVKESCNIDRGQSHLIVWGIHHGRLLKKKKKKTQHPYDIPVVFDFHPKTMMQDGWNNE